MPFQNLSRTLVRTTFEVARLPLHAVERVVHRDDAREWPPTLAFDGIGGAVKQVVGSITRDDELVREGRLAQARVTELRRAASLQALAEQQRLQADREYQQRVETEEQRRVEAADQARARKAAVERQEAERKRQAEEEARRKEAAARQVEQSMQQDVVAEERAARAAEVAAGQQAVRKAKSAVTAKAKVVELEEEIEATKAARKAR